MFHITPNQQETNQHYVYGTIVIAIVDLIIIWVKNRLKQPKYFVDYDIKYSVEVNELHYGVYKRMFIGYMQTDYGFNNRKDAEIECKKLNDIVNVKKNDKQLIK